jgi:hypothetical protein
MRGPCQGKGIIHRPEARLTSKKHRLQNPSFARRVKLLVSCIQNGEQSWIKPERERHRKNWVSGVALVGGGNGS